MSPLGKDHCCLPSREVQVGNDPQEHEAPRPRPPPSRPQRPPPTLSVSNRPPTHIPAGEHVHTHVHPPGAPRPAPSIRLQMLLPPVIVGEETCRRNRRRLFWGRHGWAIASGLLPSSTCIRWAHGLHAACLWDRAESAAKEPSPRPQTVAVTLGAGRLTRRYSVCCWSGYQTPLPSPRFPRAAV